MYFTDPSDYAGCSFLNNEMWAYTWLPSQDGGNVAWLEEGLTNENLSTGGNGLCATGSTQSAYTRFWADGFQISHTPLSFFQHNLANLTPDGTNHEYEMVAEGHNGYWDV